MRLRLQTYVLSFREENEDMLEMVRELSREVKLQNLIINNYVPKEYQVYRVAMVTTPFIDSEYGFTTGVIGVSCVVARGVRRMAYGESSIAREWHMGSHPWYPLATHITPSLSPAWDSVCWQQHEEATQPRASQRGNITWIDTSGDS